MSPLLTTVIVVVVTAAVVAPFAVVAVRCYSRGRLWAGWVVNALGLLVLLQAPALTLRLLGHS